MAVALTIYHRNHDVSDSTQINREDQTYVTPETIGWSSPSGYAFSSWNTQANGSGTTYNVGDTCTGLNVYAIWEQPSVPYLVTSTDLTSIADAIRTAGGTTAQLEYPEGFVSAIQNISGGGSSNLVDISDTFMAENVHFYPDLLKAVVDSDYGIVFFYMEIGLSEYDSIEIYAPSGYEPYFPEAAILLVYDVTHDSVVDATAYNDYWYYYPHGNADLIITGAYKIAQ